MKKFEVLNALNRISEMKREEIIVNAEWIQKVSLAAYSLIKQKG